MVANTSKRKYADSWLFFWQDHFKMAIFGRYIIGDDGVWKHFKYWLSSLNLVTKGFKTRYLQNFLYDLISAFDKFQ